MRLTERPRLADPFYYLKNFQAMLDTLARRDADLLDAEERDFIGRFGELPARSRALLVRMAMRKGALFRASRLLYPEIGPVADAVAPLLAAGWVDAAPLLTLDDLFRLLRRRELVLHLELTRAQRLLPKAALRVELGAAAPAAPAPRPCADWCGGPFDIVYRLEVGALCERLRLMFFGNFRQDLTEFVLADLGVFKYEKIALHAGSRPFHTRRQLDDFLVLHRCRQMLHAGAPLTDVLHHLPAAIAGCDWLEERRQKLRFQIAREQERAGAVAEALATYADCPHPEARPRAQRLEARLTGTARQRAPRGIPPPRFELTLERREDRSVERLVRDHLADPADPADPADATEVHYVENGLINSLFGLLCWPAIFAPVPGAFFHAFHHGPADLSSAGFIERRTADFDRCFAELRDGSYRQTLRRRWAEKAGIVSPFVAWGLILEPLLETALECFPAEHLALWFQWIARDVCVNRSGFPDLVQFWPRRRRYRLVEVKGPGDRLQENQRRCLDFCLRHEMPVSVCHVSWRAAELA